MFTANITAFAQSNYLERNAVLLQSYKKTYVRADLGYSRLHCKVNKDYGKQHDKALLADVGIGYALSTRFRMDATATWRGRYTAKYMVSNTLAKHDITSVALMLNGYYSPVLLQINRLAPYITGGVGFAINKAGNVRMGGNYIVGMCKENAAWQVGIGSFYRISDHTNLDIMYKFVYLGKVSTNDLAKLGVSCCMTMPAKKGTLKVHEISIGLNHFF